MATAGKGFARILALALVATTLVTATLAGPAPAAVRHSCHGHRATISRGPGDNKIIGTRHRDVIWAGAGNDRVLGRGGNDLICGGRGRDVIDGQGGRDTVYGGHGRDWCVAWRASEHSRHHGCEIHVGLPGHQAPGYAATVPTTAALQPSIAVPSGVTARQLVSDCGAAATCDAGVAVCSADTFDYVTAPGVQMPSAYSQDGGQLAVTVSLYQLQNDGTFAAAYSMPWKAYQVQPGWSLLPPAQARVQLLSSGPVGAGFLVAFFSYSGDGGATWSTPQAAIEKKYIFNTFAGWGNGNLVTGECNFG